MKTKVLVYGATGAQGNAVTRHLLQRGRAVLALARNEQEAAQLRQQGAEVVIGDFENNESLKRASEGAQRAFLVIPQGLDTKTVRLYGRRAVEAAKETGVELLVFNTSTRIPQEVTDVDAFEEKRELEGYLRESGVPFVSLRPTFYMGNFSGPWTKPGIVNDGVVAYPIPKDLKASWISWEDMAELVVEALERPDLAGQAFEVGGPEALDGDDIETRFSQVLNRRIKYVMVPHDAFEEQLSAALGAQTGRAVTNMYRWMVGREDTLLFTTDTEHLERTFGVDLTPFATWIRRQRWQREA